MRLKSKIAMLFIAFGCCTEMANAQSIDSLNILIDTTQNLQVNGSMTIDSSLTVKDSVIMQDNLHVYEKLKLDEDAHLQKDVYIGNVLKVEGESYFNGNTFLLQKVMMPNLDQNADYDSKYFLFTKEDGLVEKKLVIDVFDQVYKSPCRIDLNGDVPNPTWQNGLNKLFTPCPEVNVGIGTSDPRVRLDVMGKAYVTNLAIGADPTQQTAHFQLKTTNLSETDASAIFIVENNQRKLVQINNQGLLQAREIKVDLVSWPDYVFEPNYKLRPLVEVEKFIKLNGHLPNVPNAKTIESEGVNLGEMNKLLIEKVEELTLYLIEQNNQLQIQITRIENLEKTIENIGK